MDQATVRAFLKVSVGSGAWKLLNPIFKGHACLSSTPGMPVSRGFWFNQAWSVIHELPDVEGVSSLNHGVRDDSAVFSRIPADLLEN